MRAKEFLTESENDKSVTINIPITITLPMGGGAPSIAAPAGKDLPEEPVYVPPLQQELELMKQQGGKRSKVINQIVSDNGAEGKLSDKLEDKQEEAKKNYYSLDEDFDSLVDEYNKTIVT